MNSKIKYIIGTVPYLHWAVAAWQEVVTDIEVDVIELSQDRSYRFDVGQLDKLAKENCTAFVAQDNQFLNFRRYELMAEMKSRGFSMPPLIAKSAVVARSARISENTWIGAGAIIGQNCNVGFNTVIGAGANIGHGVKIGNSVWIEAGVLIGSDSKVGANTTLGQGVILGSNVEVGRQVIIDKPGKVAANLTSKTFIYDSFDDPIVTVDI